MIRVFGLLFLIPLWVFALGIPEAELSESLSEKKKGNEFLQLLWDSGTVVEDIEIQTYIKRLGHELATYSENPDKHFGFLILDDSSINAFAGPYGYIGVHTGMLLSSDNEAELAGVLSHEISHVTQNHLNRFSEKTDKQTYLMVAGMLAAALVDDSNASQAIAASTVAGTAQQSINFTREHEWEADRIGTNMLSKSGFDPQGMAHFFEKLKDNSSAEEFLRSHPLSINRISDSLQRSARVSGNYRKNSFEYLTAKARLYYHKHARIKLEDDLALTHYMQAYHAFEKQEYQSAQRHINKLLAIDNTKPSYILAGRIASKLGNIKTAQEYFNQNSINQDDEASIYYSAQSYLENKQEKLGIAILKPFLRTNTATAQSHKLLAMLYVEKGELDRSHIHSAKALIAQGKFSKAIAHYKRARSTTSNQDLYDVLTAKIDQLQQTIDLHNSLE